MRKEFRQLATPAEVHKAIAGLDLKPSAETVPLGAARGRVLAERIDADIDVPGFDRASMDGYAVRAQDTFAVNRQPAVTLELVGTVHTGAEPSVTVVTGEAVEISTGAVLPPGADAVVIVEQTEEGEDEIKIRSAVAPGDNVMLAGTDIAAGARALGPGTLLTPREVGLLAALGRDTVPVVGRLRVGLISTGDELVRPGESVDHGAGEIYDVNTHTIAAGIEEAGGEAIVYDHVGDDYATMETKLEQAADECDLVLTSGSTSASAVDVVYRVIESQGELLLHGVAVKPGKPMLVGRIGGAAYIGLPGYPVSALTIFRTFVAPAIRTAAGLPEPTTTSLTGNMAVRERYTEGRRRLLPVGLVENAAGDYLVYPVDKGSGATTSLVEADGIVSIEPDTAYLEEGESVTVSLFSPSVRPPSILGVGEADPVVSRLLDRYESARYLAVGSREGERRFHHGVPDFVVVSGPLTTDFDLSPLGSWQRDWGLVVAPDMADIDDLGVLVDRDLRFANRPDGTGLRTSFEAAIAELAAERGVEPSAITDAIAGFDRTTKGIESPARSVANGQADAGLSLRSTADKLAMDYVPIGRESVQVFANPARTDKPSVQQLNRHLSEDFAELTASLVGVTP